MNDCIFCKIRDKIIPKEFTYEDEEIMVFPDIHPVAPIHLLIIPKKHIEDYIDHNEDKLILKMTKTIQNMVKKFALENQGYRIVVNGGGAQVIDHLHIHLMGKIGHKVKM